jgi:hypothetical protein
MEENLEKKIVQQGQAAVITRVWSFLQPDRSTLGRAIDRHHRGGSTRALAHASNAP